MKNEPIHLKSDSNKYLELVKLISNYDITEVKEIIKVRSVYKIIANKQSYCLKESTHNIKNLNGFLFLFLT